MGAEDDKAQTLELVEEQLTIQRVPRELEHVRVTTHTDLVATRVEAPVTAERITITRVPKDVEVSGPLPVRHEGDVTIISLVEEVAVVTIKFVLKQEGRIKKESTTSIKTLEVDLRREYAEVERDAGK